MFAIASISDIFKLFTSSSKIQAIIDQGRSTQGIDIFKIFLVTQLSQYKIKIRGIFVTNSVVSFVKLQIHTENFRFF